ncbi:response regulator, partial [Streptomyces goshikiensis]
MGGVGRPEGVEVAKTRTRGPWRTYSQVVPGVSGRVLVVDDNKVI